MPIRVTGTMEENFPEPEMFKPERWSRKNRDTPNVFGSLPFGFGVRMCVGEFYGYFLLKIHPVEKKKNLAMLIVRSEIPCRSN